MQIREANGSFVAKRIHDATLAEMPKLAAYYGRRSRAIDRRHTFYAAIVREMEQRGPGADDRVAPLLAA